MGKLIYAMGTCRPDISFALIELSQYSTTPTTEHFTVVRNIYKYTKKTPTDRIYYWIAAARDDIEEKSSPTYSNKNNYKAETREQTHPKNIELL